MFNYLLLPSILFIPICIIPLIIRVISTLLLSSRGLISIDIGPPLIGESAGGQFY